MHFCILALKTFGLFPLLFGEMTLSAASLQPRQAELYE